MSEYMDTLDLNKLKEPAYVWIGKELPTFLRDDDDDSIPMIVALNRLRNFPLDFEEVIRYMATPREESVLREWLKSQQAPDDFIPWMLREKAILRIEPGNRLLDSFMTVHLEPYGRRLPVQGQEMDPAPDFGNMMMSSNAQKPDRELSDIMTNVLFHETKDDLLTSIDYAASVLHIDLTQAVQGVMSTMPGLLADDYAFLLLME